MERLKNQGPFLLVARHHWGEAFDVQVREYQDDDMLVATDIAMAKHAEGMVLPTTFQMSAAAGQELMDNLWAEGLRPNVERGREGETLRLEHHLADMRRIAFAKLQILAPETKGSR